MSLFYSFLIIEKIENENLLCSSGNSMICGDLNGKEIQKRGNTCICVADCICHIAENNPIL